MTGRYPLNRYTPHELCPHPIEARVDPYWRDRTGIHWPRPDVIARCRDCGLVYRRHDGWAPE